MTPTDDPDIVPYTDGADCSSTFIYVPAGFDVDFDSYTYLMWLEGDAITPDTLDTESPE